MNPTGRLVYISPDMPRHFALLSVLLAATALPAGAQDPTIGRCATPDSIHVQGNARVSNAEILANAGLIAGAQLNFRDVQRALRNLYATREFDDASIACVLAADSSRASLTIQVTERPILNDFSVQGPDRVSRGSVTDRISLSVGEPLDPALVAQAVAGIDSVYQANGYYLARIVPETTFVNGAVSLTFDITEGRRLAVSGVSVQGNERLSDEDIVGAMDTKPEGFWWWRKGSYDETKFLGDVGARIPALYGERGFIDFRVTRDTLIVDPAVGKALVELEVDEGEQYHIGSFDVLGNRRFSTEEIRQYYPFTGEGPTIGERAMDLLRRRERTPVDVFNADRWDEATQSLRTAYNNQGYIYATIRPVVERTVDADSTPVVDLRWEIDEKTPAIINRVEIVGNDYTVESCIRDQLSIVPGDVFNQDRLLRSYLSIQNLGFFESPLPEPDVRPANDRGDVDIIFSLEEKRTGNVSFGASMGQGLGVGGFISLDQPNLFGKCKRGSLQWQFGKYINDFNLSYTDPRIRQTTLSGTVSAYRSVSRFIVGDLGRSRRTGGSIQLGLPLAGARYTRLFLSYGGEAVSFGGGGLLGTEAGSFGRSEFRSTAGVTVTRDTRFGMPFATSGSMQSIGAQFNGGPLGGRFGFQRYTAESRAYVPLGQIGGTKPGSQPMVFVFGLTTKAGAVFGGTGPFFYTQEFALGGVQYGEQLRGYDEFSISPRGYVTGTDNFNATRESFGKAFFSATAEAGFRINQSLYTNLFFDAGNVYARARDFSPTRLFRGAGIGVSTVTPLGPLGLDYAYGFDRLDKQGRPNPGWQLHFRLGQLF
jgi:outer membrane protein insertion porin family